MASILPPVLQTPFLLAFEEFVNERLNGIPLQNIAIYIIDEAPEEALYYLAQQFDVLGLRGYKYAITTEQKREVIKNALQAHMYTGTPYAIETALAAIGLVVDRIEEGVGDYNIHNGQHNYDGSITYGSLGHWAYFNVYIQTQQGGVISALQLEEARDIINEFKNVRSHLKEIIVSPQNVQDQLILSDSVNITIQSAVLDSFGSVHDGSHNYDGSITYGTGLSDNVDAIVSLSDPDAQLFVVNAGITDLNQRLAINYLVTELKAQGLWTKINAAYPFVGGTSITHKYNLKNPQDTNAAYRLSFSGGVIHDSSGITPNGVNGYGDTFLRPVAFQTASSAHISFFTPTNSVSIGAQMGAYSNSSTTGSRGFIRSTASAGIWDLNTNSSLTYAPPAPVNGYYILTRQNSTTMKLFKDGLMVANSSTTAANNSAESYFIGCQRFQAGPRDFSTHTLSFVTIGTALSDADAANLNSIVSTFQTMLGR